METPVLVTERQNKDASETRRSAVILDLISVMGREEIDISTPVEAALVTADSAVRALVRENAELRQENLRIKLHSNKRRLIDVQTGLYTGRALRNRLYRMVREEHRRQASTIVIFFLDMKRFKLVNDTCGHAVGDEVLRVGVSVMKRYFRADDFLARRSGDEFLVQIELDAQEEVRHAWRLQQNGVEVDRKWSLVKEQDEIAQTVTRICEGIVRDMAAYPWDVLCAGLSAIGPQFDIGVVIFPATMSTRLQIRSGGRRSAKWVVDQNEKLAEAEMYKAKAQHHETGQPHFAFGGIKFTADGARIDNSRLLPVAV
jgi:diguanylate cyclase (GGDEF)-like protein